MSTPIVAGDTGHVEIHRSLNDRFGPKPRRMTYRDDHARLRRALGMTGSVLDNHVDEHNAIREHLGVTA